LELRNEGNTHVQVTDFALYASGGDTSLARESVSTYVLAGQTHVWSLVVDAARSPIERGPLRIEAYSDAGKVESGLPQPSGPAQ
jgi:fimbrial chaperone protein